MLDMAILGLLEERDLHGYEIRRQLRDNLGILANVSFGSIYPALTRLEKAGAVRDGGSYDERMGAVACWNAVMDENDYMVRKWNEFIAA